MPHSRKFSVSAGRVYHDLALILTWPDATIRGDEKWMMFFKKIGIVKNLNFKVGHTGIVIIKRETGEMLFYDFGRYITPRGYGRARSTFSDPHLEIDLRATFDNDRIANLDEIAERFETLKPAMHGEGILYFSVAQHINFELAKAYGDDCVRQGNFPYGAIARKNNNCSRFIVRMLMASSERYNWRHSINFPETFKASPISNIVNAVPDRMIFSYAPGQSLKHFRMNRWQSLCFFIGKLADNVIRKRAIDLPDDRIIGRLDLPDRPGALPDDAQYLGGIGDGAWFCIQPTPDDKIIIERFTSNGQPEYVVIGEASVPVDLSQSFEVTYDSHLLVTHISQSGVKIRIDHIHRHRPTASSN